MARTNVGLKPFLVLHNCKRFFGVSGSFGYSIFGTQDENSSNRQLVDLNPKNPSNFVDDFKSIQFLKYPSQLQRMNYRYIYEKNKKVLFSVFNIECKQRNFHVVESDKDGQVINFGEQKSELANLNDKILSYCVLGSTNKYFLQTKTIQNNLFNETRGYSYQIILQGRGVKAYFEDDFPEMRVRLGIGLKPLDFSRLLKSYSDCSRVYIDKSGTLITVTGFNKEKVGSLIYRIYKIVRANPYTLKGGYFPFSPPKQKTANKK